jgi:cysteinyl-tRNA synthetase
VIKVFVDNNNRIPFVQVDSPKPLQIIHNDEDILISGVARDNDGTVSRVEFELIDITSNIPINNGPNPVTSFLSNGYWETSWNTSESSELTHDQFYDLVVKSYDTIDYSEIETIRLLEEAGATYVEGGNLYLDITRYEKMGCLCGSTPAELAELQDGSKTTEGAQKRNPLDIALWRTDALHQMRWESPWGSGFPGWHVECVAMSRKYLGEHFDIHTGADDNLNPHHEFEMAQAAVLAGEGDDREPLAHYWLHSGSVSVEGQAMSKSNGNIVPVRELLESGIRGRVVRVALLSEHYRDNLDFGEAALDKASEAVNVILGFRDHLSGQVSDDTRDPGAPVAGWITDTDTSFTAALDEDLDYWKAISIVVKALSSLEADTVGSPAQALDALGDWDRVLGIL